MPKTQKRPSTIQHTKQNGCRRLPIVRRCKTLPKTHLSPPPEKLNPPTRPIGPHKTHVLFIIPNFRDSPQFDAPSTKPRNINLFFFTWLPPFHRNVNTPCFLPGYCDYVLFTLVNVACRRLRTLQINNVNVTSLLCT